MNNVRLEDSRYFRNKKREYLIEKISQLATYSKDASIRNLKTTSSNFLKAHSIEM
jgi:ribonuclease HII